MNTNVKSVWQFPVTRSGLTVVLIYNIVIAYFYCGWALTDGNQGLPPIYTLTLLAIVNGGLALFFCLKLLAAISRCFWGHFNEHWRFLYKGLGVFGLCMLAFSWFANIADPFLAGTVTTPSDETVDYKLYRHDQSVHYYVKRNDPRDGIVLVLLCTEGTSHLVKKVYIRCLYQKPGVVMGRPPMRAPGSWVTGPLTEVDTRVLETLEQKGVLK